MANTEIEQSKVFRAMETFGNIFALNAIFVLCCIPLVTIGPSLCALYSVSMKMAKKEEGAIWKSFWKAFKQNFVKGLIAELLLALAIVVIWGEMVYVAHFTGALVTVYKVVIIVEAVFVILTLPFLFPLITRYENTISRTIINSFLISVSNMGAFLKISLAWFMPIFLSFYEIVVFYSTFYVWIIFMFGLIGFGTAHTVNKVFSKLEGLQSNAKGIDTGAVNDIEENGDENAEKNGDENDDKTDNKNLNSIKQNSSTAIESKDSIKKNKNESNNRIKTDGSLSKHLYHK